MTVNSVSGNTPSDYSKVENSKPVNKDDDKKRTQEEENKRREDELLNPVDKATISTSKQIGNQIAQSIISAVL